MHILVVNAGSSSLKLRLLDDRDAVVGSADLDRPDAAGLPAALADFLDGVPDPDAAGHRVVHGGTAFPGPVLLDEGSEALLETLGDLAPLHNPQSLDAVRALGTLRPGLPAVACFDTSFHHDMPPSATTYAIPREWRERWDLRRFGFHGLSHAWSARRAAGLLGRPVDGLRLVTAHLGAGASLAAVASGRSVDTTMGFTPLEGLVMATRSGSVDPGLLLWVLQHGGLTVDRMAHALEHESGLEGLWGGGGDLRRVIRAADDGDGEARLAYDVTVHRLRSQVASMTSALGGLDGLVFTGGAGRGSHRLRTDVCAGLGFLGVALDDDADAAAGAEGEDRVVSPDTAPAAVVVVEAREDLEIARHVREVLGRSAAPPGD